MEFREKKYRNKEWLEDQYIALGKTTEEISKEVQCSVPTILNWLHKFDIPIKTYIGRKHSEETKKKISETRIGNQCSQKYKYPPKEELEHLYNTAGYTIREIAKFYGIPFYTIAFILTKYEITKSKGWKRKKKLKALEEKGLTKEKFYDLYINEKMSPKEIAQKYNEKASYFYGLLDIWDIPKRSKMESSQIQWDKYRKEKELEKQTFMGEKLKNIKQQIKNGKINNSEITHQKACVLLSCEPGIEKLKKLCKLYGFDFQILSNTYRKLEPVWYKLNEYPLINTKIALTLHFRYKISKAVCAEICHVTAVSVRTFYNIIIKRIKLTKERREDPLTINNIRWIFDNPNLPETYETLFTYSEPYTNYYCNINDRDCEYHSLWDNYKCLKPTFYRCFYSFCKNKKKLWSKQKESIINIVKT